MAKPPTDKDMTKSNSHMLPPSPTHSSSSSDFEFTISISPRKFSSSALCPADELFRDGHLLPLHPSHSLPSVVPTLLPSSSSSAARDSSGSSNDSQHSLFTATDCDSSRPSSVTDDDDVKRFNNPLFYPQATRFQSHREINKINKTSTTNKYLSSTFSRFSSVFRKEPGKTRDPDGVSGSSVRRVSVTAREVVRKYLKKVKPLYEKFSQKQNHQQRTETTNGAKPTSFSSLLARTERSTAKEAEKKQIGSVMLSHSFSGNLRHLRRKRSCVSSCPSSMRSSPTHSGAISRSGGVAGGMYYSSYNSSTMEELQSAIQGAIAHCKNSWIQEKPMVSNEI
ncbi:probable membrane-associated kinase regulator 1 [Prosopis cineraria]|uniref:probable membrane-associated kinase regulator 1 n=1 Tax=Prosopis cineraria TaxID=364024 RepID=UPI0024103634|nr:probable membrane-associated kinase regulator 1 [Prosopis cineraria]XP_054820728.1 probable membrane-associated kinase regulator 1 [Prosopis cineraria]